MLLSDRQRAPHGHVALSDLIFYLLCIIHNVLIRYKKKVFMKTNKGFTLIELLVVIAIIGLLASVVLARLNDVRSLGADASIKANLSNIRVQAEIVYDSATPNSYEDVCGNATVVAALASTRSAAGGQDRVDCVSNAGAWVVASALRTSGVWCVDSTGVARDRTNSDVPYTTLATAYAGAACN